MFLPHAKYPHPYPRPHKSHPITAEVRGPGSQHLTQVQARMRLTGSSSSGMIPLNLQTWERGTGYPLPSTNLGYGGMGIG